MECPAAWAAEWECRAKTSVSRCCTKDAKADVTVAFASFAFGNRFPQRRKEINKARVSPNSFAPLRLCGSLSFHRHILQLSHYNALINSRVLFSVRQ